MLRITALISSSLVLAFAQDPIAVYMEHADAARPLVPGEFTTVSFTGVPLAERPFPIRPGEAWPTEFGGLSVWIRSSASFRGDDTLQAMPIGGVMTSGLSCGRISDRPAPATAACTRTTLMVHVPFGLEPNLDSLGASVVQYLSLRGEGWRSPEVPMKVSPSIVRIVGDCSGELWQTFLGFCGGPMFRRPDGRSPLVVKPGEKLSLFATGLGWLVRDGRAVAGEPAKEEAATLLSYRLAFEYRPSAGLRPLVPYSLRNPGNFPGWIIVEPSYAGLAPGMIGVYRVDFVVPEPPPGALSCSNGSLPESSGAFGNLSITLFADIRNPSALSDSTRLCVDTSGTGN